MHKRTKICHTIINVTFRKADIRKQEFHTVFDLYIIISPYYHRLLDPRRDPSIRADFTKPGLFIWKGFPPREEAPIYICAQYHSFITAVFFFGIARFAFYAITTL
ncbi:unnamed protein product [Clavelina lepadiformis]|uniref:Uncharacterized protein n=1 Tax=Clavelina lepadiformis TaxID=159417 RepID=A0ABP0FS15_CLALP